MTRILGIDVGTRRVGVALSDPGRQLATGVRVIDTRKQSAIAAISGLARDHGVRKVVVGLPLHWDGRAGESARRARQLGEALRERTGLDVVYADERYTTVVAEETLREAGLDGRKRRAVVDMVAAQLILQGYLDGARGEEPDGTPAP